MMRNTNLQIEVSTLTMLRYAALAGFGFTLGILGAAEVVQRKERTNYYGIRPMGI